MFDECLILIPCTTLEDFPTQTSEPHARGLLGAWTAPWHPRCLAKLGKLPQWFRADTIPPKLERSLLLIPEASEKRLPSRLSSEAAAVEACRLVRGGQREDFLKELAESFGEAWADWSVPTVSAEGESARPIGPADFFALGYAWLQVQLMTRRLRYTSNLDEIHFSSRAVAAARAWVAGEAEEAIEALHAAFDGLAEERDHYFSSDPSLIDLTLLAPTTLGKSLRKTLEAAAAPQSPPINVLIDAALAPRLAEQAAEQGTASAELLDRLRAASVGLAGGGPGPDSNLHHHTLAGARTVIASARQAVEDVLGRKCTVYARNAGETPGDVGPLLVEAGFRGAIPIDLAAGSGWQDESKLIWQSGAGDLDALVARPIDASGSVDFLGLAPRLGQSIDSGEIATALLVHWPDSESEAYQDLRRAASWGLALGRFWKLDDYFSEGERPFHHFRGRADEGAGNWLSRTVAEGQADPLAQAGNRYLEELSLETAAAIETLASLVNARSPGDSESAANPAAALEQASHRLATALGGQVAGPGSDPSTSRGVLIINPHPIGQRVATRLAGGPQVATSGKTGAGAASGARPIFAASGSPAGGCDVTADVAGGSFLAVAGSQPVPTGSWFRRARRLAQGTRLENEFMEVEISPTTGGIQGLYSGAQRGNRFSLRLVHRGLGGAAAEAGAELMVAESVRCVRGDGAVGEILAKGILQDAGGQPVARFETRYRLLRGSRWIDARTRLELASDLSFGEDPWASYIAWRSAVAGDALTMAVPLRDLLHRVGTGNRIDSPGGVLIDEVERRTLLYAEGRPAHLRVGDRFVDSLLIVRGETTREFGLSIGIDVPESLNALRARACPPPQVPLSKLPATPFGWLVSVSAPEVAVVDLRQESTSPLVLTLWVTTTTPESCKVRLRFCRNCRSAERGTGNPAAPWQELACEQDQVEIAMAGHEAVRLRVTLSD